MATIENAKFVLSERLTYLAKKISVFMPILRFVEKFYLFISWNCSRKMELHGKYARWKKSLYKWLTRIDRTNWRSCLRIAQFGSILQTRVIPNSCLVIIMIWVLLQLYSNLRLFRFLRCVKTSYLGVKFSNLDDWIERFINLNWFMEYHKRRQSLLRGNVCSFGSLDVYQKCELFSFQSLQYLLVYCKEYFEFVVVVKCDNP